MTTTTNRINAGTIWAARAGELAAWAMRRAVNRTDVWGGYLRLDLRGKRKLPDGTEQNWLGPVTKPAKHQRGKLLLTEEVLRRHFAATQPEHVAGTHTTSPANTSIYGAVEVDWHGEDSPDPEKLMAAGLGWYGRMEAVGLRPLLTDSNGKGGLHLRAFLASPVETARLFWWLRGLTDGFPAYGLPSRPETFPKQSALVPKIGKPSFGNWLRLPGRHHTREHWSKVWDGGKWIEGNEAIDFILSMFGDDAHCIPEHDPLEHRIREYVKKLPQGMKEGSGRDDIAFNFLAFMVRDLKAADDYALDWCEKWDRSNSPPKGRERLKEILANVHTYGQKPYGSRLNEQAPHGNGQGRPHSDHDFHQNGSTNGFHHKERPVEAERQPGLEAADDPHRLAHLYLQRHLEDHGLRLRQWSAEWYRYSGASYQKLDSAELKAELVEDIKAEFDRVAELEFEAYAAGSEEQKKPPKTRKVTRTIVENVIQALASLTVLPTSTTPPAWITPPAWVEATPFDPPRPAAELLACRNGLLHLPTLELYPHTSRFWCQGALDYDFQEDAGEPREWLAFLTKVWPDDLEAIEALQEWMGYTLTTDTRHQKILMILGPKRSGKGTIARVMRGLVGIENTAGPTLAGVGTNFGLWPLIGKTVAIISDARLSGRTDAAIVTERLLSISGEDGLTIDRKNLQPVTMKLPTRFTILTNELPRLTDASGALVSRMLILRMTRSWYGQEDHRLTDKLLAELPAILNWSIEGWQRLNNRRRFVQPTSGLPLIEEIEDLSSPIGAFIREVCEVGTEFDVLVRDLFERWQKWCEEKGRKEAGNEQTFGRDLRAALPSLGMRRPRADSGRVRVYTGLRLRSDW